MQSSLVKGHLSTVWRIDDLDLLFGGQAHEPMINIVRLMVLAVHIEKHPRPNLAFCQSVIKGLNPQRLNEKEIQTGFRAMLLDAVNEQVIGVQLMRHHDIIGSDHYVQYLSCSRLLSKRDSRPEAHLTESFQQSRERAERCCAWKLAAKISTR